MQTTRPKGRNGEKMRDGGKERTRKFTSSHVKSAFGQYDYVAHILFFCFGGFDTNILKTPFVVPRRHVIRHVACRHFTLVTPLQRVDESLLLIEDYLFRHKTCDLRENINLISPFFLFCLFYF